METTKQDEHREVRHAQMTSAVPAETAASALASWPAISLWNWGPFLEGLEPPRFAGRRRYVIGIEARRHDRVRRHRWQLDVAETPARREHRLRRKLARTVRRDRLMLAM
ncbi:MAG TPA: hypothetical protein VL418_10625 [Devosiaceae bacterium]|nr:hypothetical protein [Devosiaceae bacterium]